MTGTKSHLLLPLRRAHPRLARHHRLPRHLPPRHKLRLLDEPPGLHLLHLELVVLPRLLHELARGDSLGGHPLVHEDRLLGGLLLRGGMVVGGVLG